MRSICSLFIWKIINNFVRVCGYGQFQVELFTPTERLLTPAPKLESTKYQHTLKFKTSQHGCMGIRYNYSDKEFCVLASLTKPEECFKKKCKQSKSNEVEVHHSMSTTCFSDILCTFLLRIKDKEHVAIRYFCWNFVLALPNFLEGGHYFSGNYPMATLLIYNMYLTRAWG